MTRQYTLRLTRILSPVTVTQIDAHLQRLILFCATALLSACSSGFSPQYYWQAASGQLQLWQRAQPVDRLLSNPATPQILRDRLALATEIRGWASDEMALPDNGSYRRYADLGRPFVVWNVFAADRLSVQPAQSCFPVAGCVSYRGFFNEADAQAYAETRRTQGLDVHVAGVPAYSTLGWFDDPLLNTFIHYPEIELVRLIVHELSHQIVYVHDDTEFNESFASAVEEEGVRRWLARPGKASLRTGFERSQRVRSEFSALILKYRNALDSVYRSELPENTKLSEKMRLIHALDHDYRTLRDHSWKGFRGYDHWFERDINNAALASIGLYTSARPAFTRLIDTSPDLPAAWATLRELAAQPLDERRARLGLPPVQGSP
jgi:predicted aminopeptidase